MAYLHSRQHKQDKSGALKLVISVSPWMPCPLLELCSVHHYQKGHMSTSLLLSTSQGWDTPTCNWQTFRTINKFSKLYFPYFHKRTIVLLFPRVKLSKGSNTLKVIMKITFVSIPWLLWLVLQLTRGQGNSCLFSEQFYLHVLYCWIILWFCLYFVEGFLQWPYKLTSSGTVFRALSSIHAHVFPLSDDNWLHQEWDAITLWFWLMVPWWRMLLSVSSYSWWTLYIFFWVMSLHVLLTLSVL